MRTPNFGILLLGVICFISFINICYGQFIPTGSPVAGSVNEIELQRGTRWVYKRSSLLYIYVSSFTNISDPTTEVAQKAIFFPPVDQFSKLTIPNTFTEFVVDGTKEIRLWASGFGLNTTQKSYYVSEGSDKFTVGSFTILITMLRGNVTALEWYDGCNECSCAASSGGTSLCPDSRCVTDNCAINYSDCVNLGQDTCDMKFYVGWVGTDGNNRPCTSAGSLPYNFGLFGLSPVYRAAAGVDKQYFFNISSL